VSVRTTSVQNARIAPEPAWLTDWPDPPDLAPVLHVYDDVMIAGGET
jgi:hypothetical protein